MTLIRSLYPRLDDQGASLTAQAEELFAAWKAHHDTLRAEGRPGTRPDDWLAEMVVDHVLCGARRADGEKAQVTPSRKKRG